MQGCLCVLLFRAAPAPWGWLVLFLLATEGSLILFCTSTNHQEQYELNRTQQNTALEERVIMTESGKH